MTSTPIFVDKNTTDFRDELSQPSSIWTEYFGLCDEHAELESQTVATLRELMTYILHVDSEKYDNKLLPIFPGEIWIILAEYCKKEGYTKVWNVSYGTSKTVKILYPELKWNLDNCKIVRRFLKLSADAKQKEIFVQYQEQMDDEEEKNGKKINDGYTNWARYKNGVWTRRCYGRYNGLICFARLPFKYKSLDHYFNTGGKPKKLGKDFKFV
jgi:hypothetical protein